MRKQIGIKLPEELIEIIDYACKKQFKNRTSFIEQAIRDKLNKLRLKTNCLTKQESNFDGDIEDMPGV